MEKTLGPRPTTNPAWLNADVTGLVNKNTVGYTEDGTSWPAHDEDGTDDPAHGGQLRARQRYPPGTLIKISVCTPFASTQLLFFP